MWYVVVVSWEVDYQQYVWKTVVVYAVDTDNAIECAIARVEPAGDWTVEVYQCGLTEPKEVA
jgi:hypothetical protein